MIRRLGLSVGAAARDVVGLVRRATREGGREKGEGEWKGKAEFEGEREEGREVGRENSPSEARVTAHEALHVSIPCIGCSSVRAPRRHIPTQQGRITFPLTAAAAPAAAARRKLRKELLRPTDGVSRGAGEEGVHQVARTFDVVDIVAWKERGREGGREGGRGTGEEGVD